MYSRVQNSFQFLYFTSLSYLYFMIYSRIAYTYIYGYNNVTRNGFLHPKTRLLWMYGPPKNHPCTYFKKKAVASYQSPAHKTFYTSCFTGRNSRSSCVYCQIDMFLGRFGNACFLAHVIKTTGSCIISVCSCFVCEMDTSFNGLLS